MAKKSIKSKGYRKQNTKKPYLTKKEIITAVCIFAALVLAVVLFNLLYDDGSLKVVDGVVVTEGQNSLVVNGSTVTDPVYFKIGQLADVEGFILTPTVSTSDANIVSYTYTPADTSLCDEVTVSPYPYPASLIGEATYATLAETTGITVSELQESEINGHSVLYFTYVQDMNPAAAETAEATDDTAEATDDTAEAADDTAEAAEATETAETAEATDDTAEAADDAAEAADDTAEAADDTAETADEAAAEAAVATADDFNYIHGLAAYVAASEERAVILHVSDYAFDESEFGEDGLLVDALNLILPAISYETR